MTDSVIAHRHGSESGAGHGNKDDMIANIDGGLHRSFDMVVLVITLGFLGQ